MAASQGALAKFCVDTVAPIDTSSVPFELQYPESLRKTATHIEPGGMRGTRQRNSEICVDGEYDVGGTITFNPTKEIFDFFLPYCLGAAESSDAFALAETLPTAFVCAIDKVAKVFTYTGLSVNKMTLRGSSPGLIELSLDLIGTGQSVGNAGTFPALTVPVIQPYRFFQGVLTIAAQAYTFFDFELTVDNFLNNRKGNSQTVTDNTPMDQLIMLKTSVPYDSTGTGLYDIAVAGAAGTLVFTDGARSTTFTMPALQAPTIDPTVDSKSEIKFPREFTARRTASTAALAVTNESEA